MLELDPAALVARALDGVEHQLVAPAVLEGRRSAWLASLVDRPGQLHRVRPGRLHRMRRDQDAVRQHVDELGTGRFRVRSAALAVSAAAPVLPGLPAITSRCP